MQAQDIVNGALTQIGRLGAGRTAGTVESTVAFGFLQRMMTRWGLERKYIFQVLSTLYSINGNVQPGTLGTAGTLGATRPVYIESANVVLTIGTETDRRPLEIINAKKWAEVEAQTDTSVRPRVLYCDYAFPAAQVNLNPLPKVSMGLELFTWQQLQAFASLTDTFAMPQGYDSALIDALAIEIAPQFNKQVTKDMQALAAQSLAAIQSKNIMLPGSQPTDAAPDAQAQQE